MSSTKRKIFWGLKNQLDHHRITAAQSLGNPEKVLVFKNVQLLVIHVFHRFAHRSVDILALHQPAPFLAHLHREAVLSFRHGNRPLSDFNPSSTSTEAPRCPRHRLAGRPARTPVKFRTRSASPTPYPGHEPQTLRRRSRRPPPRAGRHHCERPLLPVAAHPDPESDPREAPTGAGPRTLTPTKALRAAALCSRKTPRG